MDGRLEVSFNSPQCGWMSIGFSDGVSEFHTTTAHGPHEFALSELLRILTSLLDRNQPAQEYILKWNRDPEEFDFRFVRREKEVVIEIYQYPTDERDAAERQLVFAHHGNAREVCEAFAETFEQLYKDRLTDDFEVNWRQPFPIEAFDRFEAALTERQLR